MLRGPITIYFNTEEQFNKESMEQQLEESLASLRQQFKADGVTAKYLTGAFADCITLVNALKGSSPKEQAKQLKAFGVLQNLQEVVGLIDQAQGTKES